MSDSGQSVLLATAGYDHTIRFWEAPTGVCYKTLQHPDSQVNQLQITADRQRIAAAGNPSLRLFEINSGPPSALTTYDGHTSNVTAVGFEADGKWMYTASEDGTLKLWDLRAAGCQREYESGSPINSVALHPNQVEIVSGDRDGDSRGTGARPDPPLPVTPSRLPAGNIRVWDLAQNACSAELVPDGDKSIQSLSIARDASTLAAANVRGSVFLWRLGPAPGCGESRASADLEQCGSSAEPAEPTEPAEAREAREARAPSAADGAEPRHAEVGGAVPSRLRIEPLQKLQVRPTRGPARASRLAPPPARRRPRPRARPAGARFVRHPLHHLARLPPPRHHLGRPHHQGVGHGKQLLVRGDPLRPPAVGVGRRLLGRLGLPRHRLLGPDGAPLGPGRWSHAAARHRPPQGRDQHRATRWASLTTPGETQCDPLRDHARPAVRSSYIVHCTVSNSCFLWREVGRFFL